MKDLPKYGLFLAFLISIFFTTWYPKQSDFYLIFIGFTASFIAYTVLISKRFNFQSDFQKLLILGIATRLVLVPILPHLSDDIFRFFWDGVLIHQGINPFSLLPSEGLSIMEESSISSVFERLNSKEYYTIYPPVAQFLFWLGAFCKTIPTFSIVLKIIFLFFELITVYFLIKLCAHLKVARENIFFYFLNPLVIIEGLGNLHFEIIMLAFLAASLFFLSKANVWGFTISFVLSVGTKLVPLIFGPLLFLRYLGGKGRSLQAMCIGAVLCILIFIPLLYGFQYSNFSESLDLYFRKFEFNASIYYLLRELGYFFKGYNTIQTLGPILAIVSFICILGLSFYSRKMALVDTLNLAIIIFTIYLLGTTTVHPWYLLSLIFLGVFKPYKYILLWSYLICLSYYTYSTLDFKENMLFVAFEYLTVGYFMFKEISLRNLFIAKAQLK